MSYSIQTVEVLDAVPMASGAGALTASVQFSHDLIERFAAYLDASPRTVQTYVGAVSQYFAYRATIGATGWPSRADILQYRDYLKEAHKPTTVQNYIVSLNRFFGWCVAEGMCDKNPAQDIKGARIDRNHKKDYLTSRQVKKVLEVARGESVQALRDYAILTLLFTGGLRTVEVSRADVGDIRTAGDSTVLYVQGKGHEEKTEYVKLMPQVEDAIRAYLSARGTVAESEPLFASLSNNSRGERMTTRAISGLVKTSLRAAGFDSERLTAHSCRHTAVTLALMGGMKLEAVQQFARHRNLATTLIYAHHLDRAANKSEATIAKAIF